MRRLAHNERLVFPKDAEPYSVEREAFVPPAIKPEIADKICGILDGLEPLLAPAEREKVLARSVALLSHYFAPDMDARLAQAIAEDWADDLDEFPLWAVREACTQWRRNETRRRPTPGDIRELCQLITRDWARLARKLRLTLEQHESAATSPQNHTQELSDGAG